MPKSPLLPNWSREYKVTDPPVNYPNKKVVRGEATAGQLPARPIAGTQGGRNPNYAGGDGRGRCREGFKMPSVGKNVQRVRQYPAKKI